MQSSQSATLNRCLSRRSGFRWNGFEATPTPLVLGRDSCSQDWSGIAYVAKDDLDLLTLLPSSFIVLGMQGYPRMPGPNKVLSLLELKLKLVVHVFNPSSQRQIS